MRAKLNRACKCDHDIYFEFIVIDVRNLTYAIGGRVLLDDVSFYIPNNNLVGVVGVNGCGKSTLFRLIQGQIVPEKGEIFIPNGDRIVSIQQEIHDFSEKLILSENQ